MADEVGFGKLTLAALAERLGVRQPSLYKHLDSLAGLQRCISIEAKRELGAVLARAAVGRSGADAVHAMSHAYRAWALLHPGRYQAAQLGTVAGDSEDEIVSLAIVQVCTDALAAYQLEGDDAIDAVRAFRSALHGFVDLESGSGFGLKADIERSFERLIRGITVALENWSDPIAQQPASEGRP